MTARGKARSIVSREEAARWRHFLSKSPPLGDLIEIRRLHDNKTILRRRADLPPGFGRDAEWRPA